MIISLKNACSHAQNIKNVKNADKWKKITQAIIFTSWINFSTQKKSHCRFFWQTMMICTFSLPFDIPLIIIVLIMKQKMKNMNRTNGKTLDIVKADISLWILMEKKKNCYILWRRMEKKESMNDIFITDGHVKKKVSSILNQWCIILVYSSRYKFMLPMHFSFKC